MSKEKVQKKTKRIRKTNTFDTLFGDLLKTLQLIDGKELTSFQSELYKNTLHSALQIIPKKENPKWRYEQLDTRPKEDIDNHEKETTKEFVQTVGIQKDWGVRNNPVRPPCNVGAEGKPYPMETEIPDKMPNLCLELEGTATAKNYDPDPDPGATKKYNNEVRKKITDSATKAISEDK